jgi:ATP-dependent RNA helicase RhlE
MEMYDDDFATDLCKKPFIDRKTLKVVERDSYKRDDKRKPRKDDRPRREKPVREKTVSPAAIVDRGPRVDSRFFEVTSSNQTKCEKDALKHLRLEDKGLLGVEIVEKGRKKFFLFGERTNKYKYFVKPIYKKILTPFLVELVKKSKLNLQVRVSYKAPYLRVLFSGKDEKLLTRGEGELMYAIEHLTRRFLSKKIVVPSELKYSFRAQKNTQKIEKNLIEMVDKMKKKVLDTKKPVLLKTLSSPERRIVHQHVTKDPKFQTQSIGEGRFKRVEISLK